MIYINQISTHLHVLKDLLELDPRHGAVRLTAVCKNKAGWL